MNRGPHTRLAPLGMGEFQILHARFSKTARPAPRPAGQRRGAEFDVMRLGGKQPVIRKNNNRCYRNMSANGKDGRESEGTNTKVELRIQNRSCSMNVR